eukprot:757013-Hanusia_phi.AAC.5
MMIYSSLCQDDNDVPVNMMPSSYSATCTAEVLSIAKDRSQNDVVRHDQQTEAYARVRSWLSTAEDLPRGRALRSGDGQGENEDTYQDVCTMSSSRSVSNSHISGGEDSPSTLTPSLGSALSGPRNLSLDSISTPAEQEGWISDANGHVRRDIEARSSYQNQEISECWLESSLRMMKGTDPHPSSVITLLDQEGRLDVRHDDYLAFYGRFSKLRKEFSILRASRASQHA